MVGWIDRSQTDEEDASAAMEKEGGGGYHIYN